jgi:hypothetical protein
MGATAGLSSSEYGSPEGVGLYCYRRTITAGQASSGTRHPAPGESAGARPQPPPTSRYSASKRLACAAMIDRLFCQKAGVVMSMPNCAARGAALSMFVERNNCW